MDIALQKKNLRTLDIALRVLVPGLFVLLYFFFMSHPGLISSGSNFSDSGLQSANAVAAGTSTEAAAVHGAGEFSLPYKLIIPDINLETDVQHVGKTKTGNMAVPNNFTDVGWYKYGAVPGDIGNSVMAGHVKNRLGIGAVLKDLHKLKVGNTVYAEDENGKRLAFRVTAMETYPYDKAPLERIFGKTDKRMLNLITCSGPWNATAKTSSQRLVVFTELVE